MFLSHAHVPECSRLQLIAMSNCLMQRRKQFRYPAAAATDKLGHAEISDDVLSQACVLQGGGRLVLSATALKEGTCLPAIQLTDQGQVTKVSIMAHTAGQSSP